MNTYTEFGMDDLNLGVEALPPILRRPTLETQTEVQSDALFEAPNRSFCGALSAQNGALRVSPWMYPMSVFDTRTANETASTYVEAACCNTLLFSGLGTACQPLSSPVTLQTAEEVGFEPTEPETGSPVFETGPFDHSGTPP